MSRAGEVLATVVAWNPEPGLEVLCTTLLDSGCDVLVVDNASTTGLDVVEACRAAGASVVRMAQNVGVSGALGEGHAHAATRADPWLLTFDQDSVVAEGFVETLLKSPGITDPRVAMIGPQVLDAASGEVLQGATDRSRTYSAPLVITSGALCRLDALNEVGGFREDLFIDHVDHDICLRLRSRGWLIQIDPAVTMQHSIGMMRAHAVGRMQVRNSHHSPDRQYYKYRNYVLLVRDGTALADLRWALRTLLALAWGPLKILVFEADKAAKLTSIASGVVDGLRGRGGPRHQTMARRRPSPEKRSPRR